MKSYKNGIPNGATWTGEGSSPRTIMMPGEGSDSYEDLHRRLLLEMDPRTPYLEFLVQDIATLTWEATRNRILRDALIVAEFRELATGVFLTGKIEKALSVVSQAEAKKLADGLFSSDPNLAEKSLGRLAAVGISREEVLARASQNVLPQVEIYNRQIAGLESRRRLLHKEYRELRSEQAAM